MISSTHYLVRSRADGRYVAARVSGEGETEKNYLLTFREDYDARSYLNTHSSEDLAKEFAVESVSAIQLKGVLQRWGFQGIGLVEDPLIPRIQFLSLG